MGMLKIVVGGTESFDESTSEFVRQGGLPLELEHSLLSLSKWESRHEKPFLSQTEKTQEEVISYVQCMITTPEFPPGVLSELSETNFEEINAYIDAKMTATWFNEQPGAPKSRETITSELIYYWMITFQIPIECESWHLNRLFTLIRVCNLKSAKPKKMGRAEAAARQRTLNEQRKIQLGTKG
jgi:hypothetical protein